MGSGASKLPASHAGPMGGVPPRCSVPVMQVARSMAGLPSSSATVAVGPPLLASGPSRGEALTTLFVVVPPIVQAPTELNTLKFSDVNDFAAAVKQSDPAPAEFDATTLRLSVKAAPL